MTVFFFNLACMCNEQGSIGKSCESETGKCSCTPNIGGLRCDKCDDGFYGFPDCEGNLFEIYMEQ